MSHVSRAASRERSLCANGRIREHGTFTALISPNYHISNLFRAHGRTCPCNHVQPRVKPCKCMLLHIDPAPLNSARMRAQRGLLLIFAYPSPSPFHQPSSQKKPSRPSSSHFSLFSLFYLVSSVLPSPPLPSLDINDVCCLPTSLPNTTPSLASHPNSHTPPPSTLPLPRPPVTSYLFPHP